MSDPLPARIGRYEILELLGQGPLGRVYKARLGDVDEATRKDCLPPLALKVLTAGERAPKAVLDRFLDAARRASAIGHPGIVRVLDTGVDGVFGYVAMDRVEGGSLAELLWRGPLHPREALRIAAEAADALQAAHDRGLVHGNLKPSNFLFGADHRTRLADFGTGLAPEEDERPTPASPGYRSPEQIFSSPDEVDARTDVYSLGAVLYEMLTGRPPFAGPDPFAVLKRIEMEEPRPPGLSKPVDAVVLRALAKDPARRFATAGEFAAALRAPERKRRLAAIAGIALFAAVGFLSSQVRPDRGAEHRRAESLDRLYAVFVRHALLEGNIGIPYVASPPPLDPDPDGGPLAEAIRHTLAGRFHEAERAARDSTDPRGEVLRRNALLRSAPVEAALPGWEGTLLAALAAVKAGKDAEALRLADALTGPTAEILVARAIVLEHLGRYEQLQEALQAARAADPADPLPLCYSLAVKLSWQDDLEKDPGRLSGELLGAAAKGSVGPAPQVFLAVAHLIQGNRSLAEESLSRVRTPLSTKPDRLTAFLGKHGIHAATQ